MSTLTRRVVALEVNHSATSQAALSTAAAELWEAL